MAPFSFDVPHVVAMLPSNSDGAPCHSRTILRMTSSGDDHGEWPSIAPTEDPVTRPLRTLNHFSLRCSMWFPCELLALPCLALPCLAVPRLARPCPAMPRRVVLIVPRGAAPERQPPKLQFACLALPCPAMPRPATPSPAVWYLLYLVGLPRKTAP